MKKFLVLLLAILFAFTAFACGGENTPSDKLPSDVPTDNQEINSQESDDKQIDNRDDGNQESVNQENGEQEVVEYVCIYYNLAADDATVSDSPSYSETKKMYYSEVKKGCTDYKLLVAKRSEYILKGWTTSDGTNFIEGTPIENDVVLTAVWIDKNGSPLV